MVSSIYTGHCPHLDEIHGIMVKYTKVPIMGSLNDHYKKTSASCDYADECNYLDSQGECPLFRAAPSQPR